MAESLQHSFRAMLNQIQNHLAQIDFWYWFALGAASLLKLILWTKLPWWRFALLLAVYELLTLAALQGGAVVSAVAMLILGAAYIFLWPVFFVFLFTASDPYYDNARNRYEKQVSRLQKKLKDTYEIYPLEGSYFRLRLIRGGNAHPNLIDDAGNRVTDLQPLTFISRKGRTYGEILLRGFWDCEKCSQQAISSANSQCLRCGTPVHRDFAYYTPDKSGTCIAFTEAQPDEMARWPEWTCAKCSRHNRDLSDSCPGCGAMRPEDSWHPVGVLRNPPPGQADWQKLWALEKAFEDLPFDTPERTKRSVYRSLKIMLALITATIAYYIYRHAQ